MTSSHATLACITALPSRLSLELLASWCYSLWNSSKVHLQAHPSEEAVRTSAALSIPAPV